MTLISGIAKIVAASASAYDGTDYVGVSSIVVSW
jgi:hypothetical protein